jgi:serine/threonine-protein kinase HipA
LPEADVEHILASTTSTAALRLGSEGENANEHFRISIAGAQEKTALLRLGTAWHLPLGTTPTTPTTHILKLPLGVVGGYHELNMRDSVENEWPCAQIIRELGMAAARTEMAVFGERRALVVERFDRRWQGVSIEATRLDGFEPRTRGSLGFPRKTSARRPALLTIESTRRTEAQAFKLV